MNPGRVLRLSNRSLAIRICFPRSSVDGSVAAAAVRLLSTAAVVEGNAFSQRREWERKPMVIGVTELKRRARAQRRRERQELREIPLLPPENGILVDSLIPVARDVFAARAELRRCVSRVAESIPVHCCRLCGEVHVGTIPHRIRTCDVAGSLHTKEHTWEDGGIDHVLPLVESFHLYDRLGRAVSHEEQLQVDRIPAIVELCLQAGVDIPEYPTKRRTFPVYNVAGKMIDFEKKFPRDFSSGKDIETFGFWMKKRSLEDTHTETTTPIHGSLQDMARCGLTAWESMRSGAAELMKKYAAQTCGFCPEVQVGPKGHRVRLCQAYKHQMRDGQHAWQEASVDDLVPPVYVWHVPQPGNGRPLPDELKGYYGKLPAAVELFSQAGASIGESYDAVMRKDVAIPSLDEVNLAV